MLELIFHSIVNGLGTILGWFGSMLLWILKLLVGISLGQMFLGALMYLLGYMIQIWEYFFPPKPRYSCLEKPDRPETAVEKFRARPISREYPEECERLRKLDAEGDRTAAYRLYALIHNREPRNPEWLACLKRAALEYGNYEAQYELASNYKHHLCKEDGMTREDAIDLYRRSAAQGYRKARHKLKSMGIVESKAASADA